MKIHITEKDESLFDIAKLYGVSEELIKRINETDGKIAIGEELAVQIPTRTYKVTQGDGIEGISLRFDIRKNDLYALNPWLSLSGIAPGQTLTLKTDERKKGMSVANGYFYKDCTMERLRICLPYLTYVTFASARADRGGVKRTMDCEKAVNLCIEERKIPLMKVYDFYEKRYEGDGGLDEYAEELIRLATKGGYKGIVLTGCSSRNSAKNFISFLVILRKLMIGCDLILITEIDENSPTEFCEYADGSIFYYPKFAMDAPPSFDKGERRILSDFACNAESAKTFIDLPSVAKAPQGFIDVRDALTIARNRGCVIERNESTLLSHFCDERQGEYLFYSLRGLMELLELCYEFDYMGVCFDIMRVPLNLLMLYNTLFKTSYYANVRSREGCSREGEG